MATCLAATFLGTGVASPTAPSVAARRWGGVEGACNGADKGSPATAREDDAEVTRAGGISLAS